MYIADTTARGLHHLVYEVVDNSIDEAMAGFATEISVVINNDGSVTVEDNGRGIPVEEHPDLGFSTLQGVMTVLKFGGKFKKGAYQTSGGLHGVGVTVVNFLSEWCEVEVRRQGHVYQQEYERGVPVAEVRRIGRSDRVGTKTTFKADPQIFPNTNFQYNILHRRLQELAFLNRGVKIAFRDHRTGDGETFCYQRGIVEFVEYLNRASEVAHEDIIFIAGQYEGVGLEVALQYSGEFTENVHSFVNNIPTTEGGTHVSGFRAAITRTINAYGKKSNLYKDLIPSGDDCREGLTAVISLRVPEPQFEGQTKTKLGNSEIEGIVNSAVGDYLAKFLEENPKTAKIIVQKGLLGGRGPRIRPQGPPTGPRAQGRPERRRTARQTPRLHQPRGRAAASCTWSRAIPPAAAPKAAASACIRPSSPCAARSSTPTSRATTKCWPTKRSAA